MLRVKLRDTVAGAEAWHEADYVSEADGQHFLWTEGNFGCDCNRGLFFARAVGAPDESPLWNVPCGETRFVVVEAVLNGDPISLI